MSRGRRCGVGDTNHDATAGNDDSNSGGQRERRRRRRRRAHAMERSPRPLNIRDFFPPPHDAFKQPTDVPTKEQGPFCNDGLVVVSGPPGSGKTSCLFSFALNRARMPYTNVLFVCKSKEQLHSRNPCVDTSETPAAILARIHIRYLSREELFIFSCVSHFDVATFDTIIVDDFDSYVQASAPHEISRLLAFLRHMCAPQTSLLLGISRPLGQRGYHTPAGKILALANATWLMIDGTFQQDSTADDNSSSRGRSYTKQKQPRCAIPKGSKSLVEPSLPRLIRGEAALYRCEWLANGLYEDKGDSKVALASSSFVPSSSVQSSSSSSTHTASSDTVRLDSGRLHRKAAKTLFDTSPSKPFQHRYPSYTHKISPTCLSDVVVFDVGNGSLTVRAVCDNPGPVIGHKASSIVANHQRTILQ